MSQVLEKVWKVRRCFHNSSNTNKEPTSNTDFKSFPHHSLIFPLSTFSLSVYLLTNHAVSSHLSSLFIIFLACQFTFTLSLHSVLFPVFKTSGLCLLPPWGNNLLRRLYCPYKRGSGADNTLISSSQPCTVSFHFTREPSEHSLSCTSSACVFSSHDP